MYACLYDGCMLVCKHVRCMHVIHVGEARPCCLIATKNNIGCIVRVLGLLRPSCFFFGGGRVAAHGITWCSTAAEVKSE